MIDRPAVTRETRVRLAVTLLLPSPVVAPLVRSNEEFQRSKSTLPTRGALLPVLIVSLSYCSAVSVLLNPRLVDLEHLVTNKAARRISLVKLLRATLPVRYSLFVGSATLGTRERVAQSASAIAAHCSLAFKSIRRRSRSPRSQQGDPNSRN